MANVVQALALVEIAAAWVRVPKVAATKMGFEMAPYTEGAPIVQQDVSGRPAHYKITPGGQSKELLLRL